MTHADVATSPASSSDPLSGRNRVTSRALNRVAVAVTADALGIAAKYVGADLADQRGMLEITVSAAIPVASLGAIENDPRVLDRSGGTLLERCARAQQRTHEQVERLTGRKISGVNIRLTKARIQEEARVR